ncbi:hypothetical protein HDU91_007268, partial [Kappamyces sp. JEL0680]
MNDTYMKTLNESWEGHKEYEKLVAKLENRRLDFDAKLNKVQKSKKENTALEEETRAAQAKYEETLEVMTQKMLELNSQDDAHHRSLLEFIDLQQKYFSECATILSGLKDQLADSRVPAPQQRISTMHSAVPISKISNRSDPALRPDSRFGDASRTQTYGRSTPDYTAAVPITNLALSSSPPRPMSVAKGNLKQAKVLFDFDAENENELTIRVGDIVDITEEIDAGWWVGTIQGTGQSGMFPSNYTEVLKTEVVIPAKPRLPSGSSFADRNRSSSYQPPQPAAAIAQAATRQRSISENRHVEDQADDTIINDAAHFAKVEMFRMRALPLATLSKASPFSPSLASRVLQSRAGSHKSHDHHDAPAKMHPPEYLEVAKNWPHEEYAPTNYGTYEEAHKTYPETKEMAKIIASSYEEPTPVSFNTRGWHQVLAVVVLGLLGYRLADEYAAGKEHPVAAFVARLQDGVAEEAIRIDRETLP